MRFVLGLTLIAIAAAAAAQDYQREARWRAQVEPTLVVGEAVDIEGPGDRKFLGLLTEPADVDRGKTSLALIVHGMGVHPDHGVVGALRMRLADRGIATLSIQMPVLASDAAPDLYPPVFPNAAERIARAAAWARAKGYRDLVLVSHSMGGRMANAYFDSANTPAFRRWIALGTGAPYSANFSAKPSLPVVDVYGERDYDTVLQSTSQRGAVAKVSGGSQHRVAGADHFFAGKESELVAVVTAAINDRR
jgi:predicted alpha/beta-hydrolase family hydrolase